MADALERWGRLLAVDRCRVSAFSTATVVIVLILSPYLLGGGGGGGGEVLVVQLGDGGASVLRGLLLLRHSVEWWRRLWMVLQRSIFGTGMCSILIFNGRK